MSKSILFYPQPAENETEDIYVATPADDLSTALAAFKVAQEDYEAFERAYTAAVYRGERPNKTRLEKLEREYNHAAIFAANVMLGREVSKAETAAT